jgi:hypothetical protein
VRVVVAGLVSLTPEHHGGIVVVEECMPRGMEATTKRPRISLDVGPELRRQLRLAAAKRDLTVRRYVLDALEERLREDLGDEDSATVLTATSDPVLARFWQNDKDAAYDALSAG